MKGQFFCTQLKPTYTPGLWPRHAAALPSFAFVNIHPTALNFLPPQACNLLRRTNRAAVRLNRAWEWQTDVHKHALTVFQYKHNGLHLWLSAVNADLSQWNLNGIFGCIILCCIISNYGPYAMLLWQLRGHSHLYKHVTGILMERSHDRPVVKVCTSSGEIAEL